MANNPSNTENLYQVVDTISADHKEVHELAKHDMDFFAGLALPLVSTYAYPDIFKTIWTFLIEYANKYRDFSKIAIGIPRGFAKTSVIKLFIVYCILYTHKSFIAVLASTASHAQNIIADVCSILDEPNIKAIYGDWTVAVDTDNKELKKFSFRGRTIILIAIGQGGSVRGINIDNKRPDVMIFDDIQTREDADSDTVSAAIETWMLGTAMKAASHTGCLYIFLANMYPTKWSILRKLKKNVEWIKFIVGGILADGTSLWEDLKPIKQLLAEYSNDLNSGHPEIFNAEVLNDENANINNNIDLSRIPTYPFDDEELSAGNFIIIDPSNDKNNSDAVSIGLFHIYNGIPVIRQIKEGRFSPGDTIKTAIEMAISSGTSLILIEANAYQYSLCYWFEQIIMQNHMFGLQAVPIYSGSRSKNSRILDMFKALLAGELYIHPECVAQVHNQIVQFNPLKTNNVDGILDLLTYSMRVLTEFGHYITINNPFNVDAMYSTELSRIEDTNCF